MLKSRRPEMLAFIVAIYVGLILNRPFWHKFVTVVSPDKLRDWAFIGATAVAMVLIFYLVLLVFSLKPLLRAALFVLLPIMAAASYFMGEYGIVIDANMVRNVFETDLRETGDLMTPGLIGYVFLWGLVPAVLLSLVPWIERSWSNEIWAKSKCGIAAVVVGVACLAPFWGDLLSVGREHRELRMTLSPVNYVSALRTYWRREGRTRAKVIAPYGQDAHRAATIAMSKSLFVIVVGETARADHFSLNGYERQTNPQLSNITDLINFPRVYSCGTDTAQSVPCMFSGFGHDGFTNAKAEHRQNLLDILKQAGIDVLWRENQAGCKGVCARVETETLTGHKVPTFFPSTENYDDILVDGLDKRIAAMTRDTVIVLHMMGSHGPAYWKRYPPNFETFTPVCKSAQFSHCALPEIVNAYDNSLVYTDHVLARLIGVLSDAGKEGVATGMLYVSDHGESLGEHGMYLHGMPYALAPEAQIHVPMVVWLSPRLRDEGGIDQSCMVKGASERVSHDNLFHSMLGIMNVRTRVYEPALDLFAGCRTKAHVYGAANTLTK